MISDQFYYVTQDIIGHRGNVYARKGDKVTILDRTPGTEGDVVLIKNGRISAWIQEEYLTEDFIPMAKPISKK